MKHVVIIGPAHPLKEGGLAAFNHRMARGFLQKGFKTEIYTFSLQYPSFLFPGSTQYSTKPPPHDLNIHVKINSINPFNWLKVGKELKEKKPDIIVVRYWLPFMGPALGTILKIVSKNQHTKIICLADNIIPHEKRPGDTAFTRYFIRAVDGFITMSDKVLNDLKIFTNKPAIKVNHPLYDNFGLAVSKSEARKTLNLPQNEKIILFFGFIRKYKGLDMLLEAMHFEKIKNQNIKLLVAGEFYENEKLYLDIINQFNISQQVILKTGFISEDDVKYYLCACDFVIQPYKNATQSGVTPLAYHFEKPMLVTNVGSLADMVPDKKAGVVTNPNPKDIADGICLLYELGEEYFLPHLRLEKHKYSWNNLLDAVVDLANIKN